MKAKQELLMQRQEELDQKRALRQQIGAPQLHSKIPKPLYKQMEENFREKVWSFTVHSSPICVYPLKGRFVAGVGWSLLPFPLGLRLLLSADTLFLRQVVMPELEKRKQALKEIRERFEKGPDLVEVEERIKEYHAQKKKHEQVQLIKKQNEKLMMQNAPKPYKGKLQADVLAADKVYVLCRNLYVFFGKCCFTSVCILFVCGRKERKRAEEEKIKEKEMRVARAKEYAKVVGDQYKPVVDERKREELIEMQRKPMSKVGVTLRSTCHYCVHEINLQNPAPTSNPMDLLCCTALFCHNTLFWIG